MSNDNNNDNDNDNANVKDIALYSEMMIILASFCRWEKTYRMKMRWQMSFENKYDSLVQKHDSTTRTRGRADVWQWWQRYGTLTPNSANGNDESSHSVHLQTSRKLQEYLYR